MKSDRRNEFVIGCRTLLDKYPAWADCPVRDMSVTSGNDHNLKTIFHVICPNTGDRVCHITTRHPPTVPIGADLPPLTTKRLASHNAGSVAFIWLEYPV